MKFSVGYQLCSDSEFVDEIIKNRDSIYEVYFSWSDYANGRNSQIRKSGLTPWEAQRYIEEDIKRISDAGIKLKAQDPPAIIVNDGCLIEDALTAMNISRSWVDNLLRKKGLEMREVFLLTVDGNMTYNLIKKEV